MKNEFPKLILLNWQEGDDEIIAQKGWFSACLAELENGNRYEICFFDLARIKNHLEDNSQENKPFFY